MTFIKIILSAVAVISIVVFSFAVYLVLGRKKSRAIQVKKEPQSLNNTNI